MSRRLLFALVAVGLAACVACGPIKEESDSLSSVLDELNDMQDHVHKQARKTLSLLAGDSAEKVSEKRGYDHYRVISALVAAYDIPFRGAIKAIEARLAERKAAGAPMDAKADKQFAAEQLAMSLAESESASANMDTIFARIMSPPLSQGQLNILVFVNNMQNGYLELYLNNASA